MQRLCWINELKFDGVMTLSPHKGMDLAKFALAKWYIVYFGIFCIKFTELTWLVLF